MAYLTKRGKKWQARISWRDAEGKLHQKSKGGFDTKQQARQYAVKLEKIGLMVSTLSVIPHSLITLMTGSKHTRKPTSRL